MRLGARRFLEVCGEAFRRFARGFGRFNSAVLLSLVYFLVLTPMGVVRRLFSHKACTVPSWQRRRTPPPDHFENQF